MQEFKERAFRNLKNLQPKMPLKEHLFSLEKVPVFRGILGRNSIQTKHQTKKVLPVP